MAIGPDTDSAYGLDRYQYERGGFAGLSGGGGFPLLVDRYYDRWNQPRGLSGLGSCPSGSPTVIVEATQIPPIVWWIAGGIGLLLLLKRR
jgi:hypothetical protein